VGTYKIGEFPWHNASRVLLLGEISQNTHRNKKRELFMYFAIRHFECIFF
jgi:hypothetical protein